MSTKLTRKALETLKAFRSFEDIETTPEEDILTQACAEFSLNDFGHVARLIVRFGDKLRFVPEWGWVGYDGKRWDKDTGGVVATRLAQETLGDIVDEAEWIEAKDPGAEGKCPKKERFSYGMRSCSSSKVKSLLESAQNHLLAASYDFDTDPNLLGAQNGVVDLRTGKLHDHSPDFMITRLAGVDYDPDAQAPRWMQFLEEITINDKELETFLQDLMGYSAYGHQKEEICVFMTGDEKNQKKNGSNGKSKFLETYGAAMGEYKTATGRSLLVEKGASGGIPNDVAKLQGARVAIGSEFKRTDVVDEERYKQATGADTMQARFLQKEFFDFRSTATAIYSTNTIPLMTGLDDGTKRRLVIVPFLNKWYRHGECPPGGNLVDLDLEEKLLSELVGVFAWVIRGAISYHQKGRLHVPDKILAVRNEKMDDFNELYDFQSVCLEQCDDARVSVADLTACYQKFAAANGASDRKFTPQWFGRRLNDIGCVLDKQESRRLAFNVRKGFKLSKKGQEYLNKPSLDIQRDNKIKPTVVS